MTASDKPKVSVITSLYRGEKYLEVFLKAFRDQDMFSEIEMVIDHNEPSPKELALIEAFKKENPGRIKHLTREKVVPYSASWNRCIKESSSDIVAIWSVDDIRSPDSLSSQIDALLRKNADIVFGPYTMVKTFPAREGEYVDETDTPHDAHLRTFHLGPFFMFRKSLCEKAGYMDEQFRSSADFDFAIRLAMYGKIATTDRNLGYYLNEGKGLSTNPNSVISIETTAIQMRYGIYEDVSFHCIPKAIGYDISRIKSGDQWIDVVDYCSNRNQLIRSAYSKYLPIGIKKYIAKTKDINFLKRVGNAIF